MCDRAPAVAAPAATTSPSGGCTVASDTYEKFIQHVRELNTARAIAELLDWDQETYMPPCAAEQRGQQMALISGLAHEKLTSDEMGNLVVQLDEAGAADDPTVATNVRELRREYDRAVKIPTTLVQEIAQTTSRARQTWLKARQEANFAHFAPQLARLLDLKRQVADLVGWDAERYDALIDEFEPQTRAAPVQELFDRLKAELVPLVAALQDAPRQPDTTLLERECPAGRQAAFNRRISAAMGFDFEAGRIDVSAHPFCISAGPLDVRITTRYNERYLPGALFGTMHETGHGLYEQGFDPQHTGTPMASSVSLGIHESQSRTWENLVGRSRPFWEHFFPALQAEFPTLADVALDDWYFAINVVRPSFIRVEADEVTYGLHIMLRFDLERQMVAGQLAVDDIPDAWNTRFREYLGITPPNDAEGCLQDIHWSMGIFGYFLTYQLGNLYAAQFFQAARRGLPDLDEQLRRGELAPLREWLRENIHVHGKRYRAHELVHEVTGAELSHKPYIDYLHAKYKPLYGV
ncbi:MAG: carboxypeptidase M32 [Planctomycetes bacterium]|nr:carboxypeptidase M32 [Planctomycetota bacterium]